MPPQNPDPDPGRPTPTGETGADADADADADRIDRELDAMWRGAGDTLFDRMFADVNIRPSAFLQPARSRNPNGPYNPDVRALPSIEGFAIIRHIGTGGMGEVYEATQLMTQRRIALKVMRSAPGGDDQHRQSQFDREVRVLARISHPFIATIRAAGQTRAGRRYLAMELIHGANLLDFINARGACAGGFPLRLDQRLRLFCDICKGIEHAHQRGVVHRDLKPSNILVVAGGRPKIVDFGLASLISDRVDRFAAAGTLRYMSPEQTRGHDGKIDLRSDVYSLGVILYELLTDQPPYRVTPYLPDEARRIICECVPPPPSSIDHGLPHALDGILAKALEKTPAKRFKSAAALARAIDDAVLKPPRPKTRWQLFWSGLWRK